MLNSVKSDVFRSLGEKKKNVHKNHFWYLNIQHSEMYSFNAIKRRWFFKKKANDCKSVKFQNERKELFSSTELKDIARQFKKFLFWKKILKKICSNKLLIFKEVYTFSESHKFCQGW